jgi:ABC-type antimicrobial peptide transport system permease subunit
VVKDAKYRLLRDPAPPTIYIPITQNPMPFQVNGIYELRFAGPLAGLTARVKETVRAADQRIALQFQLLSTQIDDSLLQDRLLARLASFFGVLALVLASIGLYGVVAYAATRRRAEIGIRMALGATRGGVIWLVLRETAALLLVGIPLGLAATLAAARLVRTMLFGLTPTDPSTLAGAIALLLLVAAVAGYVPARHAARVDPLAALREE